MRHANSQRALVVLLVDGEHVLDRLRGGVSEERDQERHIVHRFDVVSDVGDAVRETSL